MNSKWTAARIKASKGQEKLACLTAYDYTTACILDEVGIPLILVGDSLAQAVLGYDTTLPVTMDEMLHHTIAVTRGVRNSLVVADMPFMSYQVSAEDAVRNACRFVKQGGAGAVKIEGGAFRASVIRTLVENGVPVLGHIGLTPQSIRETGGYKVQGKTVDQVERLLEDAREIETAGCFALVLECMPTAAAAQITAAVRIPTIGIGAGNGCDGQILVINDMLGFQSKVAPKFVKRYAECGDAMRKAFQAYKGEVESGAFPDEAHSY